MQVGYSEAGASNVAYVTTNRDVEYYLDMLRHGSLNTSHEDYEALKAALAA